jgi:demethylmenaquinone methyltransferase / 2-methoxy-6-polyprenyl-1,4-benzoquinol methylase
MNYQSEKVVPYDTNEKKGAQIEQMFDSIATHYDSLNRTMSMGLDISWRRKGLKLLGEKSPQEILDIATGTGDLAIMAHGQLHPKKILGVDISEEMMKVGKHKVESLGMADAVSFAKEDCMELSFDDNSFDAAMVAFGVRNFEDLDKGLKEIRRVLKPGGQLMILELSTPRQFPMKQGYWIYSRLFIPTVGRLVSKSKEAYTYLPKSIEAFVQGKEMVEVLLKNGFSEAKYKTYTFGVCSMYLATK